MRSIVILSVLACAIIQAAYAAPADTNIDCSKIDEVMNDLGAAQGLSTLHEKYPLQGSEEEHLKRCKEMDEAIKTLKMYNSRCYTTLTQQVFSAILRTRAAMNEARCKPDTPEMKEAAEAAKCIKENAFEPVKGAEKQMVVSSTKINEIPDEKLRLRRACCAVLDGRKAFLDAAREKCGKHEKIYAEYIDSYTSESMSLVCPDQDKLACSTLETLKFQGEPQYHNFMVPMLKLVKSIDH